MKRLSDYKGDEAIELWADLLESITTILSDKEIADMIRSGRAKTILTSMILKKHKDEASEILLRIDPEPLNGLNIFVRLMGFLAEIGQNEDMQAFFGYAVGVTTAPESSGSATANIEENEI